ncbi:hypothetical protein [Mobiluncus porci]|uniref:DUF3040 domain-containing protein n=1 Tax=Mobiluncus porci TaxID=2652278 RepID=A0A7K0K169_9ACTO|nr:hypothetical protein [Mobiluncus porci]MST48790.1 hypothetical protein [Mobiluncus porci]
MSLFPKRRPEEFPENDAEIERRFEELAAATPELGGFGPRDWSPAEDTEGFIPPDPPLPRLRPATMWGWILLAIALGGFIVLGILRPAFSAVLAGGCLLVLAVSFYLLMFKKR